MRFAKLFRASAALLMACLVVLLFVQNARRSESVSRMQEEAARVLLSAGAPASGPAQPAGGATQVETPSPTSTPETVKAFEAWVRNYRTVRDPAARAALEQEGIRLAKARLATLADLTQIDPERALRSALPHDLRTAVPAPVAEHLEVPINATADLAVLAALPVPGDPSPLPAVMRTVTLGGEAMQAFTYGAGNRFPTRSEFPVNGIAVPNDAASVPFVTPLGRPSRLMALSESPARWLEPTEIAEQVAQRSAAAEPDPTCGISGQSVTSKNEETQVQWAGSIHTFCGKVDAEGWVKARMAALGLDTPGVALASLDLAESSYTEGRKRMLLMRPVWSDYTGGMTTNDAVSHWQNFSNYMFEMSHGKLVLAPLGKGSDITPAMTLPGLVAEYDNSGLGSLYNNSRNVAESTYGYKLDQYDFFYVCTDGRPAASYCGLAYVGGVGFHLANRCWDAGVSSHEFGHNLGLNHAHFWDTASKSIIGTGQNVEYGDNNDPMGGGASPNQYNSRYKNYLGWIRDSDIADLNASGSGTYRLYAFDLNEGSGIRGLKFRQNSSRNYWIQFRQRKTDKKALMNGVQLLWTGNGNEGSYLLDVQLKGNADNNAITLGRTFSDSQLGFHFTPVRKANTYPEAMDVVVNIGTFPTNRPPLGFVTASPSAASQNQVVTFSVDATDPDGDTLAYSWDFGDGDFSTDNQPVTTHRFVDAGEYAVQCVVSDMKGGVLRKTVLVQVGSSPNFRISGHVLDNRGNPVAGARVSAGTTRRVLTDSDGSYVLPNLPAGSYAVTVDEIISGSLAFSPFFENPVTVGPSREDISFIALQGSLDVRTPLISRQSAGWKYLDTGVAQPAAWIQSNFDDRLWKTGTGTLGYGNESGQATVLSFGGDAANKIPTYYFRKSFVVKNPLAYTNFAVEVLRDDGVAVYLNGREFFRNNLPAGTPSFTTYALDSVEPDSYLLTTLARTELLEGTNWIAAEVHQVAPQSSDVAFDFAISGISRTNVSGLDLVYIREPSSSSRIQKPSELVIRAAALSATPVTQVDFYQGTTVLGTVTSAPYDFTWASPSAGTQVLRAVASIGGILRTSPPVFLEIVDTPVSPDAVVLVPESGPWRYLSRSTAAPASWATPAFDDSGWSNGVGSFGFGQPGLTTVINGGPSGTRYNTVYFRTRLVLEDPAALDQLVARLRRDDGAVVYFNGTEVFRDNMPTGSVNYATVATSATDNGATGFNFALGSQARQALVPGTNVIAVEVHQSGPTSSDLVFELGLSGTVGAPRPRGCYVVSPETGSRLPFGKPVTLAADAVPGGTLGIASIEFLVDGQSLGKDTQSPFTLTWNNASPGTHTVQAVAVDSAGASLESLPMDVQVDAPLLGDQLVSLGSVWKYLDDGSNQGTNWSRRSFDDSSWPAGPARLGYGLSGLATVIRQGTNTASRQITAYFRQSFVVPDPSRFSDLRIALSRNDGAAVYLNGTEVFRDNLPASRLSYNTLALTRITGSGDNPQAETLIPASWLLAGTNVIAVELHQLSQTSADANFDLSLTGLRTSAPSTELLLTSPAQGTRFNQPASFTLTAALSAGSAPDGPVEFWADGVKLGETSTLPYTFRWNAVPIGPHGLTARTVRGGQTLTSQEVLVHVIPTPSAINPVLDRLVPLTGPWKYSDAVLPPALDWNTTSFDDSAWPSGPARFGFGLDGELTTLSAGRTSYYFRKSINVTNPAAYSHLVFQLARDDGAVVHLNGRELFRSNMPSGLITASTPAVNDVKTPEETTYFETLIPVPGSGLAYGSNVVAVELHQQSPTSTDAAFELLVLGVGTTERRVTILSPDASASVGAGVPTPVQAAVQSGGPASVLKVQFLLDGVLVSEDAGSPWTASWEEPALGTHQWVARAFFSDGGQLDSAPLTVKVSPPLINVPLLAANGVWKYSDLGQNLGTAWRAKAYDDSSWSSGAARLGYGDDGETTSISFGGNASAKFITTYFRAPFEVNQDWVITNLSFRYQRDDGLAVYMNGQELFRDNLGAGAIYTTAASADVTGVDEQTWFTRNIAVTLSPGSHVVAAEVHQSRPGSSDLGFALELIGTGYQKTVVIPRPKLDLTLLPDGKVQFSWPESATGFRLVSSASVEQPLASWTVVDATPSAAGGKLTLVLQATGSQQFYRLARP